MIGIPELLVVVAALALAGGYILIVRYMLNHADK